MIFTSTQSVSQGFKRIRNFASTETYSPKEGEASPDTGWQTDLGPKWGELQSPIATGLGSERNRRGWPLVQSAPEQYADVTRTVRGSSLR